MSELLSSLIAYLIRSTERIVISPYGYHVIEDFFCKFDINQIIFN